MNPPRDRLKLVLASATLNGIDYVEIVPGSGQKDLEVHFLKTTPGLQASVTRATISGGDSIPTVAVLPITSADWASDQSTVTLHVAAPGDFSYYTLTLSGEPGAAPPLDPYFNGVLFTFKAGCESTLDCERIPVTCEEDPPPAPPIDYLAKDFESFKRALYELSAARYPEWKERSEADFGVMFMEALSSVADDLSYFQDRVAAESTFETATERRSIVRHARLVDYEPRPRAASRVILRFDAVGDPVVYPGILARMPDPAGGSVEFETGTGLLDEHVYQAHSDWNVIQPHYWDDSRRCLKAGATEAWIVRTTHVLPEGQWVLVDTTPEKPGDAYVRELVTLAKAAEADVDPLLGVNLWHIVWTSPLQHEHDLTRTTFAANIVPATHGRTYRETFAIGSANGTLAALVRTGANGSAQYLHTLDRAPLAWLPPPEDASAPPRPEIRIVREDVTPPRLWTFAKSMLDADEFGEVFTVDPARYVMLRKGRPNAAPQAEYDGRDGASVRFGDGAFGVTPNEGSVFRVTYRVGGGSAGNVAADSITEMDLNQQLTGALTGVTNPFPATAGEDEETDARVRVRAPYTFRTKTFRAVRREDYESAAQTLPWVQRAATRFRYTGSWFTTFTAADPKGGESLSLSRHLELIELIERRRLAGRESYVLSPRFVALDILVVVCARRGAYRGDVERAVLDALSAVRMPGGETGFFHPDRMTFGQSLERSVLEARIQEAPGVDGVRAIFYLRRGLFTPMVPMPPTVTVGPDEILRVDSNPSRPERGSVAVKVYGGK